MSRVPIAISLPTRSGDEDLKARFQRSLNPKAVTGSGTWRQEGHDDRLGVKMQDTDFGSSLHTLATKIR